MGKITITEALAEVKTAKARITKKQEAIKRYFARDSRLRDPLEKDGGTAEFVRRERQAIADLEARVVAIRCAIQGANLSESLEVNGESRTIAAWLNWRREVAAGSKAFIEGMARNINQVRGQALEAARRDVTTTGTDMPKVPEIEFAVDEGELSAQVEQMEKTLGDLDGRLSLANATVTIEV